jgi:PAS domain-containing protein
MFGAFLVVSGILLGQTAPTPPAAELKLEVRRLVRQLNAPRLADRNAAEERLLGLGPAVLEHLPTAAENTPAEVEQRVARVRQVLQQKLARSAAQASTVTLRGNLPLSDIIAALEEQTGNTIVGMQGFNPRALDLTLEVALDQTPFWQALDQVADQANLTVYNYGPEKAVTLRPRVEGLVPRVGRACYQGPFRFEPSQIEAVRNLRAPTQQSLNLTLEVAWEPKLSPISLLLPMDRIEAVDENGNRLTVDGQLAELEVPVTADAMASELRIPLVLPPRSVKQIARLKGAMTALLPGKIETFRFKDLEQAKEVEQRIAGVTVMLEGARKNNEVWEVRIRVRFDDAGQALQSHRNWIFDNEVSLQDPDGKSITWGSYETTRQTENEVGLAYLFSVESLKGFTLLYKTPGVILTTEIPYEIKDVPLP